MKKIIITTLIAIILLGSGLTYYILTNKKEDDNKITDAQKFKIDYPGVTDNNVFVYKNAEEIIKVLENGTGIVYLGYPECSWCQEYVIHLNDLAINLSVDKIYYFNVYEDRKNNTDVYKKLVELIGDQLLYDNEGNHRIYVPDVSIVKDGEIIGHDNETSKDTKGFSNAKEYWSEKRIEDFKKKMQKEILKIADTVCTSCN